MNGSNKKICIFNDIILKFDKVIWKEICKYLLTNDVLNLSFTCKNIRKQILKSCFSKILFQKQKIHFQKCHKY